MARNGSNIVGLRPTSKADFDKFKELVDKSDGWVKQYNKQGAQVYTKSQEGTAIKMIKVYFY